MSMSASGGADEPNEEPNAKRARRTIDNSGLNSDETSSSEEEEDDSVREAKQERHMFQLARVQYTVSGHA